MADRVPRAVRLIASEGSGSSVTSPDAPYGVRYRLMSGPAAALHSAAVTLTPTDHGGIELPWRATQPHPLPGAGRRRRALLVAAVTQLAAQPASAAEDPATTRAEWANPDQAREREWAGPSKPLAGGPASGDAVSRAGAATLIGHDALAEGVTPAQRADGGTTSRHASRETRDCPRLTRSASDTRRPRSLAGEVDSNGNEEDPVVGTRWARTAQLCTSRPWEMP